MIILKFSYKNDHFGNILMTKSDQNIHQNTKSHHFKTIYRGHASNPPSEIHPAGGMYISPQF